MTHQSITMSSRNLLNNLTGKIPSPCLAASFRMFLVLQSMGVAKSILKFADVAEKVFPVAIYGQAGQLAFPHLVMPGKSLLGLAAGCLGTLALTSLDLRLGGTLYATR